MDKKQIIHIASEVVVISGLAVYFKLKNNSLMKMIEELENKLETQQESINEFQTRFSTQEYELHRHELILSSLVAKARNMKEDNNNDMIMTLIKVAIMFIKIAMVLSQLN